MAQTDLDIANAGISRGGGEKIGSFAENTSLAAFAVTEYPAKRRFLLSAHRWVFAKRVVGLQQITAPADCPYTYAFNRPAGLVGAIHDFRQSADDRGLKVHVLQLADYIASDEATVWAEYTAAVDEAQWPPWFVELVTVAFAVDIANARGRQTKAQLLDVEAFGNPEDNRRGGLMGAAMNLDGRNAPKRVLQWENGGALVEARTRGAGGLSDPRLAAALLNNIGG